MTTFRSRARRAPCNRAFHPTRAHRRFSTTTADANFYYWRETGAKQGDFRLQTAMMGSVELRVDTKKSITYLLRRPLPRLGSRVFESLRPLQFHQWLRLYNVGAAEALATA